MRGVEHKHDQLGVLFFGLPQATLDEAGRDAVDSAIEPDQYDVRAGLDALCGNRPVAARARTGCKSPQADEGQQHCEQQPGRPCKHVERKIGQYSTPWRHVTESVATKRRHAGQSCKNTPGPHARAPDPTGPRPGTEIE